MIRDAQGTLQALEVYRTAGDAQSHFSQLGSNIPIQSTVDLTTLIQAVHKRYIILNSQDA